MQKLDCILLVDDDEITNFVHESIIEEVGAAERVLTARNGQEALELVKEQGLRPDGCPTLIFLDINMPVMNGFEFLEAYQALDDDLKQSVIIVMLTTSLSTRDTDRVQDFGIADFLNKPLSKDKLRKVLEEHF